MFGYIISILLPPIAMVQQGRVLAALFTLLLCCTVFGYPIAILIASISTRAQHTEAIGINDTGQIVCNGYNPTNGQAHAFLLNPS